MINKNASNPKKRVPTRYSSLSKGRLTGLTRRLIKKHQAFGYGEKLLKGHKTRTVASAKDWMHPKIRRAVKYMLERNIFDNRLDSRKNISELFERVFEKELVFSGNQLREEVYLETKSYLNDLIRKNKDSNPKDVVRAFDITVDLISQRIDNFVINLNVAPKSKKKSNYYYANARGAFAHEGHLIPSLGESARSIKQASRQILSEMK